MHWTVFLAARPARERESSAAHNAAVTRDSAAAHNAAVTRDSAAARNPAGERDPAAARDPAIARDPASARNPAGERDPVGPARGPVLSLEYSSIVINEIYYDHPGPDGGHEYVEIYNAGSAPVEIGGWILEGIDGLSWRAKTVWIAPPGEVLEPLGFLLVGGAERVADPAYRLTANLENGPDAVALRSGGGVVDLVGYGPPDADIPCEGRPAPDVPAGRAIARCPDGRDTDDNLADFVDADPTPGGPNFFRVDLALRLEGPDPLVCAGAALDLCVRIENTGLETYSGTALLRAWRGDRGPGDDRETPVDCGSLPPGGGVDVRLGVAGPLSEGDSCFVALEAAGDVNTANDTLLIRPAVSPGPLVISEIMYRPAAGEGEWIELFNRSGGRIDLSGWSISDRSGATGTIAAGTASVDPGAFLIVAEDGDGFARLRPGCRAPVVKLEGRWPRLNDRDGGDGTADEVTVRDARGALAERVAYPPLCGDEYGRSVERVSPDACSAMPGGVWQRCADPSGATAGSLNSVHTPALPAARISVEPNPFGPRRDGRVRITAAVGSGERAYAAGVYNLDGVRVRRLAAGESGAGCVSFLWDGRGEDGRPVAGGVYVCVVEFVMRGGGICRREKCALVVAGGG